MSNFTRQITPSFRDEALESGSVLWYRAGTPLRVLIKDFGSSALDVRRIGRDLLSRTLKVSLFTITSRGYYHCCDIKYTIYVFCLENFIVLLRLSVVGVVHSVSNHRWAILYIRKSDCKTSAPGSYRNHLSTCVISTRLIISKKLISNLY